MKNIKKLLTLGLSAIIMTTTLGMTTFAAEPSPSGEEINVFDILNTANGGVATNRSGSETTYTVTDPALIAQLSDGEKLPDKIELTYVSTKKATEATMDEVAPLAFDSYELRNIKDHGDGWYNATNHQLYEFYIDGPDTFVIDETQSYESSVNCSVSAAIDDIEAGVGFEMGESYELHIQSNTPVPSGQRLHVEIFRTHQKVTFDLYKKPFGGSWSKEGSYEALKPNGVFIKKEFWKI
ncbi:MAG: hypothetical protein HFH74_09540 [Lachnospiraceae bacterium]|jgi:hypothetical protein|nr:hypothetical protein [Lachnospiraceae bacterium]